MINIIITHQVIDLAPEAMLQVRVMEDPTRSRGLRVPTDVEISASEEIHCPEKFILKYSECTKINHEWIYICAFL